MREKGAALGGSVRDRAVLLGGSPGKGQLSACTPLGGGELASLEADNCRRGPVGCADHQTDGTGPGLPGQPRQHWRSEWSSRDADITQLTPSPKPLTAVYDPH